MDLAAAKGWDTDVAGFAPAACTKMKPWMRLALKKYKYNSETFMH